MFACLLEVCRTFLLLFFLLCICSEAFLFHLLRKRNWFYLVTSPCTSIYHFFKLLFYRIPATNIHDHVRNQGYYIEDHVVKTEDGYLLGLHRIRKKGRCYREKNGVHGHPVLCMHGLLNTSLQFVLNGKGKAIAFDLYEDGYDVWLGNSRGNVWFLEC